MTVSRFANFLGTAIGLGQPEDKVKFDPKNAEHLTIIEEKLKTFITKRDQLTSFDKYAYGGAAALDTVGWLLGFYGITLTVLGYIAIGIAMSQQCGRQKFKLEFDKAAKDLFEVYNWYAKDQKPVLSFDAKYIQLLEALLPVTQDWRQLLPWDLTKVSPYEISPGFIKAFEESPHHVVLVLNKQEEDTARKGKQNDLLSLLPMAGVEEQMKSNRYYQFFTDSTQVFARTAADVKLKVLYGQSFDQEQGVTPRP